MWEFVTSKACVASCLKSTVHAGKAFKLPRFLTGIQFTIKNRWLIIPGQEHRFVVGYKMKEMANMSTGAGLKSSSQLVINGILSFTHICHLLAESKDKMG